MNLSHKAASIFGAILFIVITSSLATIYSIFRTESSIRDTTALNSSIEEILKIQDEVMLMRNNVLEFTVSGDLIYKEKYIKDSENFNLELESFKKSNAYRLNTPPKLKEKFELTMKTFSDWKTQIANKQFKYAENPYTFDMARVLEVSQENKDLWKTIDKLFSQIELDALHLIEGKVNEQKTSLLIMKIVSIISGLLVVGACIISFIVMNRAIIEPVKNIIQKFIAMSDFDLSMDKINISSQDEIGKLSEAFNILLERFQTIINSVKSTTGQMATASEEMSSTMKGIMGTMESQSEASSQIAIAIQDSSQQSQEVNSLSISSQRNVVDMSDRAADAEKSMQMLKENSDRIVSVLGVINDIADQVNLLALNAAIEAARAGDAGRGFAVVAEEVKKLAENVSKSTNEVQEEISGLGSNVIKTSEALQGITGSLQTVHEESSKVTSSIEHQSSAIEEISSSVDSFSQQVTTLSHALKEMEEVSHSIANEASKLDDEVAQFKT